MSEREATKPVNIPTAVTSDQTAPSASPGLYERWKSYFGYGGTSSVNASSATTATTQAVAPQPVLLKAPTPAFSEPISVNKSKTPPVTPPASPNLSNIRRKEGELEPGSAPTPKSGFLARFSKAEQKGSMEVSFCTVFETEEDPDKVYTAVIEPNSNANVVEVIKARMKEVTLQQKSPAITRRESGGGSNLPMMKELRIIALPPYDNNLSKLPTDLLSMRTLQKLTLQWHNITLPNELCLLPLLQELVVTNCRIRSLPNDIGKLAALRVLNISYNNVTTLPNSVGNLTNLEILKFRNNEVAAIPEIGKLSKLKILKANNNKISTLPSGIALLSELKVLNLASNQLMTNKTANDIQMTFFSWLKELTKLTYLDISNNNINIDLLPSSINSLIHLEYMNLSHNQFYSIPWQICGLSKLTKLDISYNSLAWLPEELERMNLIYFNATANKILNWKTCDPVTLDRREKGENDDSKEVGYFNNLQECLLSKNELSSEFLASLFAKAAKITKLDLSFNSLSDLPKEIQFLKELKELNLSSNSFSSLPQDIFQHIPLEILNLSNNNLKSIAFSNANVLRELDLSQNALTSGIDLETLPTLEVLRLQSDKVTALPKNLPPKLRSLSILNMTLDDEMLVPATDLEHQLQVFINFARANPHPLIVKTLAFFISLPELRHLFLQNGGLAVLVEFTDHNVVAQYESFKVKEPENEQDRQNKEEVIKRVQKEALKCISDLCESDTTAQTKLDSDALDILIALAATVSDTEIQLLALKCLGNVAFFEKNRKSICDKHELDKFIPLLTSEITEIQCAARRLLCILGANEFLTFTAKKRTRGVRILALDGGGTRGLIAIQSLKKIEELLGGKKLWECFDIVCGTSTGGVIATLIGVRKYDAITCEQLYKGFARKVFALGAVNEKVVESDPESLKDTGFFSRLFNYTNLVKSGAFYQTVPLVAALKLNCGAEPLIDTTLDPDVPKVFMVSTLVSKIPPTPFIFRNYTYSVDNPSRYQGDCHARIYSALQASTAAPSYFDEYVAENGDRMIDGGLHSNNPSGLAIHESIKLFPNKNIDCIVSLGTGRAPSKPSTSQGLRGLLSTLVKSSTSSEKIDEVIQDFTSMYGMTKYFRINPSDARLQSELDETREDRLKEMLDTTNEYINENIETYKQIAECLKDD